MTGRNLMMSHVGNMQTRAQCFRFLGTRSKGVNVGPAVKMGIVSKHHSIT